MSRNHDILYCAHMLDEAFKLDESREFSFDELYGCLARRYRSYAGRRHTADNEGLPVNPNIPQDGYFAAFCMDNPRRLGVRSVIREFAADWKNGRKKRDWERIKAGQYENILLQHADEAKRQMMRPRPVTDMIDTVCGNVLDMIALKTLQIRMDMDVSDSYVEDALYYDDITTNDCVDTLIECFGDPAVCGDFDDAYDRFQDMKKWADFGEGQYTSDYATLYAMSLIGACPAEPDVDQAVVCLNRCLDIFHGSGDISLAFIEGGLGTLNRIRYAHADEGTVDERNNYFYDEPVPKSGYEKAKTDVEGLLAGAPYAKDPAVLKGYAVRLIGKDTAASALETDAGRRKFGDFLEDIAKYLQNRRYYAEEYVKDVAFGVLWFRMKRYEGK